MNSSSGGSGGLINPILDDTGRLELVAWNQFWLSDRRREIGSATSGNTGSRVAVWARVWDRETGGELVHLNTHLDHVITQAKVNAAQLIADHLRQFHLLHLPAVVTGDFNSVAEDSPVYAVLVEEFGPQYMWRETAERTTPGWGTFPHFGEVEESDFRIDWILASPGVEVLEASINAARPGGVFPSDHLPVPASVRVPVARV
ncbi:endonuclease/exonuclease/phosphatase family protein [Brachybacterium paraconglomeratum]